MGFFLTEIGAAVPTELKKGGELHAYVYDKDYVIHLPIKTLEFKKQCKFITLAGILAELRNDEYYLVLREDGTGAVHVIEDGMVYLVKNFKFPVEEIPEYHHAVPAGFLKINEVGRSEAYGVYLTKNLEDGQEVIFVEGYPLTVALAPKKNLMYLDAVKHNGGAMYPCIIYDKVSGRLVAEVKGIPCDIIGERVVGEA